MLYEIVRAIPAPLWGPTVAACIALGAGIGYAVVTMGNNSESPR